MNTIGNFLLAALVSLTFTVRAQNDPLAEAKKAIAASNDIYFQSFEKNDSSVFIDRYAQDCHILAPDMPPFEGHEGAGRFFRLAYDNIGLRNGKFITTAVYGDGREYVTEEGVWQSFDAHHALFDNGKFLVLWKKTPQGWKMFRDSFSSDRLPQKGQ
jgi:ketosteroid isomerase-like protein